jgi:hypothetical protein
LGVFPAGSGPSPPHHHLKISLGDSSGISLSKCRFGV